MPSKKKQRTLQRKEHKEHKAAEEAYHLRMAKMLVRNIDEEFKCNCCFEPSGYFVDGEVLEYGYLCRNGHMICFNCWLDLNDASGQILAETADPWQCPTCRVYTKVTSAIPNGIVLEGGITYEPAANNSAYYFKQGGKMFLTPDNAAAKPGKVPYVT